MGFMDKVKSGFSEAGSKAKVAVEVNKLKMQNNSKQKEIDKHYQEIGRIVFLTAVDRTADNANMNYQPRIEEIVRLETEIEENKNQIKKVSGEKDCVCGKTVPLDVQFCPSCGQKLFEQ